MSFKDYIKESVLNESSTLMDLGVTPEQMKGLVASRGRTNVMPSHDAEWEPIKGKAELKKAFTDKGNMVAVINPDGTLNIIMKKRFDKDTLLVIVDADGKVQSTSAETIPKALSRAGKGKYYYSKSKTALKSPSSEENEGKANSRFADKIVNLISKKAESYFEESLKKMKEEVNELMQDGDIAGAHRRLSKYVTKDNWGSAKDPISYYEFIGLGGWNNNFSTWLAQAIQGDYISYSQVISTFEETNPNDVRKAAAEVLRKIKDHFERES